MLVRKCYGRVGYVGWVTYRAMIGNLRARWDGVE